MESVGAAGDESDVVVQSFGAGVVYLQSDGGEDAVAEFVDGLGGLDEWGQAGAAGLGAPAVDELDRLLGGQVAGEDLPEGLFEAVGAPELTAAAAELAQGGRLVVGEVLGSFEQAPPGALELLRRRLVGQSAQLVPGCPADHVQGIGDGCLLYTSDAADEEDSVDLGG